MFKRNFLQNWYSRLEDDESWLVWALAGVPAAAVCAGVFGLVFHFSDSYWVVHAGAVLMGLLFLPITLGINNALRAPTNRAFQALKRELSVTGAAFNGHYHHFWNKTKQGHNHHFKAQNGLALTFCHATLNNIHGLKISVAVDKTVENVSYFLAPHDAPVLLDHSWSIPNFNTHVDLPYGRLKDLNLRLADAVTELVTGTAPARPATEKPAKPAKKTTKETLSGLTRLSDLRGENQAPWFNNLVNRAQEAALRLAKVVDLKAPTADDLTNHLAPQLAAMLAAAHPLVQSPDDTLYPELRTALDALVGRLESYNQLSQRDAANGLTLRALQVLQVSQTLPDPVLR